MHCHLIFADNFVLPNIISFKIMKEDSSLTDNLFERLTKFAVTYVELIKLKAIDRTTEVVSAAAPDLITSSLMLVFLLFINVGVALWLGDILGKIYFGFMAVAGFYLVLGLVFHFFMRGWFKKVTGNYLIKQVLK